MTEVELKALEELACELTYREAVIFISAVSGCDRKTAYNKAESLSLLHPDKLLGKDFLGLV